MLYLFCGAIIGIVMGLTGAGGALVAIPLFMHFFAMSLKEASVYSLLAVVVASLLNYFSQRISTQYKTAIIIVFVSAIASYITAPFKEILPTFYVALILSSISLYALYSVWKPAKAPILGILLPARESTSLSIFVGFILGTLTTFTGLGGGVLMLPLFLAIYRFSQSQAVATSLFAVGLSSLASLLVQISLGASFNVDIELGYLMIGILASVLILKQVVKSLPITVVTRVRQIVFTFVVILAISKIF
jgi:uncharacterized protein